MSDYEHGRILAVNEVAYGDTLVGDIPAGATSLTVEDPVDFDEDGGWLVINDQVIEYSTYDDDTGEIFLVTALDDAAEEGDRVDVWDPLYQVASTEKIAQVELDGEDDNVDPIEATIPHFLVDRVSDGLRGLTGESVLLEEDGDEWRIVDMLGLANQSATGSQFWQDSTLVSSVGTQTVMLTHEPLRNSEHVYWNGLYQPASEWSRNGRTITVEDPLGHMFLGDELTVEYAYQAGVAAWLSVPLGSNWRYKTGLGPDPAYADPAFDDSLWGTGPSGFGLGGYTELVGTVVPSPLDVWTRINVTTHGGSLLFSARQVDKDASVYLDGELVWSLPFTTEGTMHIGDCPAGDHVIAIYGSDDPGPGMSVIAFEIEERP